MTHQQFIQSIDKTFEECVNLVQKKNADYASSENPFKNFESAAVANISVEKAIVVRVLDKLSRISNLLDKEPAVVEEKLEDTLLDCQNYICILSVYIQNERNKKNTR